MTVNHSEQQPPQKNRNRWGLYNSRRRKSLKHQQVRLPCEWNQLVELEEAVALDASLNDESASQASDEADSATLNSNYAESVDPDSYTQE